MQGSHLLSWLVLLLFLGSNVSCASWRNRTQGLDTISTCRQLSLRGGELLEQGHIALAEKALRRAVELNPTSAEAHRQLAELLWNHNAKRQAVWHMETACGLAHEDVTLLVRAGEMRLAEGDLRSAATWARHALGADPKYAEAWVLRGKVLAANGNADQALADFYHALGMLPDSREVLREIATVQMAQNRPLQSLTTVQRLLDLYAPGEEPQDILMLEGATLASLNRHRDAAKSYQLACLRRPPDAHLLHALAREEMLSGNRDAAITAAKQAIAIDATYSPALALLAKLSPPAVEDQPFLR